MIRVVVFVGIVARNWKQADIERPERSDQLIQLGSAESSFESWKQHHCDDGDNGANAHVAPDLSLA